MQEYSRLEPEEKEEGDGCGGGSEAEGGGANDEGREERVISEDWPRSGHVEFRNVTIRYDPEGPDIIRNVDLEFKPGQRVAIVGRTGSGKTTVGDDETWTFFRPMLPFSLFCGLGPRPTPERALPSVS